MKTAKIYFATILSLMFCSELVSQSAADSIYYAKAKEEGRVLLYTSLATDDNNAFRSAFERANGCEIGYLSRLRYNDFAKGSHRKSRRSKPGQCHSVEHVKELGSPVDWVRIEDPLYGEPHPAAVMARAPHPNAARLFVEFAISKEGGQLMSKLGKVPGRSDVQPKIGVDRKATYHPAGRGSENRLLSKDVR